MYLTKLELKTEAYKIYELIKDFNSPEGFAILKKAKKVYIKENSISVSGKRKY